jgi:hypothetical protein
MLVNSTSLNFENVCACCSCKVVSVHDRLIGCKCAGLYTSQNCLPFFAHQRAVVFITEALFKNEPASRVVIPTRICGLLFTSHLTETIFEVCLVFLLCLGNSCMVLHADFIFLYCLNFWEGVRAICQLSV